MKKEKHATNNISEIEAGTDLTALIWKSLQSSQIQKQLDQSHNMYTFNHTNDSNNKDKKENYNNDIVTDNATNNDNSTLLNNLPTNLFLYLLPYKNQIIQNIDEMYPDNNNINNNNNNNNKNNNNYYYNDLYNLYSYFNNINNEDIKRKILKSKIISAFVKNPINLLTQSYLWEKEMERNELFEVQNYFCNINNFIDLRKNRKYVIYCLSDNVERCGLIEPHIIFNKMPIWLVDALQYAYDNNLYLVYSTDIRGVNQWMGQLCSLINIHNLLNMNENNSNNTALLLHIAGILSLNSLNAINRQGMWFSNNVLQRCTFENIKKLLSNVSDCDDLSSFISTSLMCLPQKSGTNYFDLKL